ncbi:MAG: ATP-binding protein [Odoribacter sp.]|nr:ATP-binding protein [Odoribacter sp.]
MLNIKIEKIKNINFIELNLPIQKGLYAISGANGTGKSTIMTVVSKVIRNSAFDRFQPHDYSSQSKITISFNGLENIWTKADKEWICNTKDIISLQGFYEGSIIHGVRFSDASYATLLKAEKVDDTFLTDADSFVQQNLSLILHGCDDFYKNLKRIKNRKLAQLKAFKGIPYFIEGTNGKINQFCMSAGENMLISLLHMLNVVIACSEISEKVRLILIDEIELALHPSAIMRLVDFLQKLSSEYNLAIYFSSHSIELLRQIKPEHLFHLQKELSDITIINPCYPSYATRDIYQHSGYDFLILVEDVLAKYLLENIIDENALYKSKLVHILPSGGWQNVLRMQDEICKSNLAGVGTKVLSILDGDVKSDFDKHSSKNESYVNLTVNFLPIHSLEKYLYEKIIINKDTNFFKEIGDRFFKVKSLKVIVDSFSKRDNDKAFYNYLIKNLNEQGIDENVFVQKVCEIIYRKEDVSNLLIFLKKMFNS